MCKVNGSEYTPMLQEGRSWQMSGFTTFGTDETGTFLITLIGDTLIDNRICFKAYSKLQSREDSRYMFALYEDIDHRTVYYYLRGSESPNLLCHFNYELGDSIFDEEIEDYGVTDYYYYYLTRIDTIDVNNHLYRRNVFSLRIWIEWSYDQEPVDLGDGTTFYDWSYLVEGIGPDIWEYGGRYAFMKNCYDGDKLLFTESDFKKKGYVNRISLLFEKPFESTSVNNLQGRRLQSNKVIKSQGNGLPKGIYI